MEVDAEKALQRAREIALRKTEDQYPYPHHMFEKRMYFAKEAARQFCDMVLPGGYASLAHYPADTSDVK